eukprot:4415992-Pleurochrysis_carterae.AAC.3
MGAVKKRKEETSARPRPKTSARPRPKTRQRENHQPFHGDEGASTFHTLAKLATRSQIVVELFGFGYKLYVKLDSAGRFQIPFPCRTAQYSHCLSLWCAILSSIASKEIRVRRHSRYPITRSQYPVIGSPYYHVASASPRKLLSQVVKQYTDCCAKYETHRGRNLHLASPDERFPGVWMSPKCTHASPRSADAVWDAEQRNLQER